eukprot:COSAG01_NODE_67359_length_267_cov_0.797619_1_plen_25_part_10
MTESLTRADCCCGTQDDIERYLLRW